MTDKLKKSEEWLERWLIQNKGCLPEHLTSEGHKEKEQALQTALDCVRGIKILRQPFVNCLIDMVNQHCQVEVKDGKHYIHDYFISSNEDAIELLESLGYIKREGKKTILLFDKEITEDEKVVGV